MKRYALLPTAVGVLSTLLVACSSTPSEETVVLDQNTAQNRRIAGENWARTQEQKARSDFNARSKGDPIYSRISSAPNSNFINNNQTNPNNQYAPYGINYGGNSSNSTGDLLKVGALGMVMMAFTQGFNGKKAASALGFEGNRASGQDKPEARAEKPTALSLPSGTAGSGQASLSVNTDIPKDAREEKSVKTEDEAKDKTAQSLTVEQDEKTIGTNGLTFETKAVKPEEETESFEIAQAECEGPLDPEVSLKDDIRKIFEGSESELGGAQ